MSAKGTRYGEMLTTDKKLVKKINVVRTIIGSLSVPIYKNIPRVRTIDYIQEYLRKKGYPIPRISLRCLLNEMEKKIYKNGHNHKEFFITKVQDGWNVKYYQEYRYKKY